MGVSPGIWGPNLWGTLHLVCLAGSITSEFVQEFAKVIPCPMCAAHFTEMIKENPLPDSDDPSVLFEWSVQVHNIVNERIGKPIFTVEDAAKRWLTRSVPEQPRELSEILRPSSQFDFKIGIIMALVLALIFMYFSK